MENPTEIHDLGYHFRKPPYILFYPFLSVRYCEHLKATSPYHHQDSQLISCHILNSNIHCLLAIPVWDTIRPMPNPIIFGWILQIFVALNSSWASIAQRSASSAPAMERLNIFLVEGEIVVEAKFRQTHAQSSPHTSICILKFQEMETESKNKSTLPRAPIAVFKTSLNSRHL